MVSKGRFTLKKRPEVEEGARKERSSRLLFWTSLSVPVPGESTSYKSEREV